MKNLFNKITAVIIILFVMQNVSLSQNEVPTQKNPNPYNDVNNVLLLTFFDQGYYDPGLNIMNGPKVIDVSLRGIAPPFPVITALPFLLPPIGAVGIKFPVPTGPGPFYVVVEAAEGIETWSAVPVLFPGGLAVYNFTLSPLSAFGSNEIQVDAAPPTFAAYSGDVLDNDFIDVADLILVYNDVINFAGAGITDINNDGLVDITDLIILYNNLINLVSVVSP